MNNSASYFLCKNYHKRPTQEKADNCRFCKINATKRLLRAVNNNPLKPMTILKDTL